MADKILIVDDDEYIRDSLAIYLKDYGYDVDTLPDGLNLLEDIRRINPKLLILDIKLPGKSGMDVLADLRKVSDIPVLILTGLQDDVDMIVGLEAGADDYIIKPFNPRTVLARVRALIRRSWISDTPDNNSDNSEEIVRNGPFSLNLHKQQLVFKGRKMKLPPVEFRLIHILLVNANIAVSRNEIMKRVFDDEIKEGERKIDIHVTKLRKKLENLTGNRDWIRTDRGKGYLFTLIK